MVKTRAKILRFITRKPRTIAQVCVHTHLGTTQARMHIRMLSAQGYIVKVHRHHWDVRPDRPAEPPDETEVIPPRINAETVAEALRRYQPAPVMLLYRVLDFPLMALDPHDGPRQIRRVLFDNPCLFFVLGDEWRLRPG